MTLDEFNTLRFGKGDEVIFTIRNVDNPKGETTYRKPVTGVEFDVGVFVPCDRDPDNHNIKQLVHYSVIEKYIVNEPQKWHQCEHPDSEGFYDLPPESGEYIVQVRTRAGRPETFATEFDADYSDWPELINGTVVIQWCEEPKPLDQTNAMQKKENK